ncbi:diguanylate cyclase domain-containing protein [Terribacillus saccharophilus]|uniref:sensor domain-containing diguanylate cyclase n=1 Tax=Terribacillus saccharophilus TaxID=361277 RepID=UPI00381F1D99
MKQTNDFDTHHQSLLSHRIKLSSITLLACYPLFLIADISLYRSIDNPDYVLPLALVHLTGMLMSACYLLFFKSVHSSFLSVCYIGLYIAQGAFSSFNSFQQEGNMYAYLIILLACASLLPIRPIIYALLAGIAHIMLLGGLFYFHSGTVSLIMLINFTGALVVSAIINLSFYHYLRKDYNSQMQLEEEKRNFKSLFFANPQPVVLIDLVTENIILYNKQAGHFFGINPQTVSGFSLTSFFPDKQEQEVLLRQLKNEVKIENYITHNLVHHANWMMLNFELLSYNKKDALLISVTDITSFKRIEKELQEHASRDVLTGVFNRRAGIQFIEDFLQQGKHPFCLCFVDVNNLKRVNDEHGHNEGDQLIQLIASTITLTLTEDEYLFRHGGDEFIILLPQTDRSQAEGFLEKLQESLTRLNDSKIKAYPIAASFGIHDYAPGSMLTVTEMIEIADQEMYKSKQKHKEAQFQ